MQNPDIIFTWNVDNIANALHINSADVILYFTDGRKVSFVLERRIANELIKGTLAPNEGAGYDLLDADGRKWEVRSISKQGIYFCPSYMVGSGRSFKEEGFLEKLEEIEGYIVSDLETFPNIPSKIINGEIVEDWWHRGLLGTTTKISRPRALKLIASLDTKSNRSVQKTL